MTAMQMRLLVFCSIRATGCWGFPTRFASNNRHENMLAISDLWNHANELRLSPKLVRLIQLLTLDTCFHLCVYNTLRTQEYVFILLQSVGLCSENRSLASSVQQELKFHKHLVYCFSLCFVIFYRGLCESIVPSPLFFYPAMKNIEKGNFLRARKFMRNCARTAHALLFNFALIGASAIHAQRRTGGFSAFIPASD